MLPHLVDVNQELDFKEYENAKFFIIKSFNEENIFKVKETISFKVIK